MHPTTAPELQAFYEQVRAANRGAWPDFEPIIQRVYETLLQPGDSVIDGGASRGRHTFPMASAVAPSGTVFAVEPLWEYVWRLHAKRLERSPEIQRVVRVHQLALSDSSGEASFLAAEIMPYSGLRRRIYPRSDMGIQVRTVRTDRLDNFIRPPSRVKFIKLDLEGGEFHAMRGGIRLIEKHRPVVLFEHDHRNTPKFYGYEQGDLLDFFEGLDYRILDILGNPFDDRPLWEAAEVWYYVALPREAGLEATVLGAIGRGAGWESSVDGFGM